MANASPNEQRLVLVARRTDLPPGLSFTDLPSVTELAGGDQHTLALLEARHERGPAARNRQAHGSGAATLRLSIANRLSDVAPPSIRPM